MPNFLEITKAEYLKTLIDNKDMNELARHFFGEELTEMQCKIVEAIFYGNKKRVIISAYTRYGKSFAVAIGACLYILFNKSKRIILIGPQITQSSIIRNYITANIIKCQELQELLDTEPGQAERLKKEISKSRITFRNGCELQMLSASGMGERLMGHGGDLIIEDESCLIDKEVHDTKIMRMLGDSPDSVYISIGNPWNRENHFFENWINPSFEKIHIPWQVGLKEGRITQEYIDEQRQIHKLKPRMFKVLFDAEFPEDSEDAMFSWEKVSKAIEKGLVVGGEVSYGIDVGELGNDLTVITKVRKGKGLVRIENIWAASKKNVMQTVGWALKYLDKESAINVDSTGVGAGVYARLLELGYNAQRIMMGQAPETGTGRQEFHNKKAQAYWDLKEAFENETIDILEEPTLKSQLLKIRYEFTSSGKIRIIKNPEDKSPDYVDSLVLAVMGGFSGGFAIASSGPIFQSNYDMFNNRIPANLTQEEQEVLDL